VFGCLLAGFYLLRIYNTATFHLRGRVAITLVVAGLSVGFWRGALRPRRAQ